MVDSERWPTDTGLLSPAELGRAEQFRQPADGRDYRAARHLAREVVADLLGLRAGAIVIGQLCPQCGSESHGRPFVSVPDASAFVSWSHASGVVAAAAGHAQVGVDVERLRGRSVEDLLPLGVARGERREVLGAPDPEAAFLELWTCKEALAKVGHTSIDDFPTLDLSAGVRTVGGWCLSSWGFSSLSAVVAIATPTEDARIAG